MDYLSEPNIPKVFIKVRQRGSKGEKEAEGEKDM